MRRKAISLPPNLINRNIISERSKKMSILHLEFFAIDDRKAFLKSDKKVDGFTYSCWFKSIKRGRLLAFE
jgi:hypothetical protein